MMPYNDYSDEDDDDDDVHSSSTPTAMGAQKGIAAPHLYEHLIESFLEQYEPAELGPDSIDLTRQDLRAFFNAEQQFFVFSDPLPQYIELLKEAGFKDVESPYSYGRVIPVKRKEIPLAEEFVEE